MNVHNIQVETCSRTAHEVIRSFCVHMGDRSHKHWEEMTMEERIPAIMSTTQILNSEYTPEMVHDAWLAQKLASGWTYGPVKDVDKKTHPALLKWKDLPSEQAIKNNLFCEAVKITASALWRIPSQ